MSKSFFVEAQHNCERDSAFVFVGETVGYV